ncbi:MAG: hypothetical protein ABFC77_11455 [Thermoguttaceae bacterium]
MTYHTKAIYRQGAFFPLAQCDFPEDSQVELLIQGPSVVLPVVTDAERQTRVLRQVTDRMKRNPLPAGAVTYSRDQLHERH